MPLDIYQLLGYKGALYPASFTVDQEDSLQLLDLCCEKIVFDSSSLQRSLKVIPSSGSLYKALLRAALRLEKAPSVQVLIYAWPERVLALKDIVPPAFAGLETVYDDEKQIKQTRHATIATNFIASSFIKCLKNASVGSSCSTVSSKLRFLDLTGFPISYVTLQYLTAHCQLVFKEYVFNSKVDQYNRTLQILKTNNDNSSQPDSASGMGSSQIAQLALDVPSQRQIFPPGSYHIAVDAALDTEEILNDLCKALVVCNSDFCRLKLYVSKIDILQCGVENVLTALECMDAPKISGIRLQDNSMSNTDILRLCMVLPSFTNLTALDLSRNLMSSFHTSSHAALSQLGSTLSKLPHLSRLDVSNNRLRDHLRLILEPLLKPLQYLKAAACTLSASDLEFLAESIHVHSLTELDLSENLLSTGNKLQCVLRIMEACARSLQILMLEDTRLTDDELVKVSQMTVDMTELLLMDVCGNEWQLQTAIDCVSTMNGARKLKAVKISYPLQYYTTADLEDEEAAEEVRNRFLSGILQAASRIDKVYVVGLYSRLEGVGI